VEVRREQSNDAIFAKLIVGARIGLDAWAALVSQRASLKAPVATSQLAQSIHYLVENAEGYSAAWRAVIGTNLIYAAAQEYGSGLHDPDTPHMIPIPALDNVGAKTLRFQWPGAPPGMVPNAEGFFFFKSILHPGVRAQPYLRPALEETNEEGKSLFLRAIAVELQK